MHVFSLVLIRWYYCLGRKFKKNGNVDTCFFQITLFVYRCTTNFAQSFLVSNQIAAVNVTTKFNFRGYIIYMYLMILIEL